MLPHTAVLLSVKFWELLQCEPSRDSPPGLWSLLFLPHTGFYRTSLSSLLPRVCDKSIQQTEEATLAWRIKAGPLAPTWLQITLPSPRALCCLKKQTAGDAGSEGQPSLCGLAEEEVIVQPGSGPGSQLTPDFSRQGWDS